eukprot:TRINITY_DN26124_c0_g1_i1.p1 TRINITY_DN26124_c0_g1~~TRINITY_DN26124_c0_g1_i1.p1  ORF type:complete len:733 (-),score=169.87 TRINITY_DN26124_c0_g1_i1:305-2386(-)
MSIARCDSNASYGAFSSMGSRGRASIQGDDEWEIQTPVYSGSRNRKTVQPSSTRNIDLLNQDEVVAEKLAALQSKKLARSESRLYIPEGAARRKRVRRVVESQPYRLLLATATVTGIAFVAIETDVQARGDTREPWLMICNLALLGLYIVDVALRLFTLSWHFFRSIHNMSDFLLVILDIVLELWTGIPSLFAALKAVRFLRLVRFCQTCSDLRELYLMMMGILSSVRALLFASILMFFLLTLFSILAVYFVRPHMAELMDSGAFGDSCLQCESAFDTVMNSNLTLMSILVANDGWERLATPLIHRSPAAAIILLASFLVVNLGFLNTIAAVIVDRQAQARLDDMDYTLAQQSKELLRSFDSLRDMFLSVDVDGNGDLTLSEVIKCYESSDDFRRLLNRIDVHKADLPVVFDMIDADGSGCLEFTEFVTGLHSLSGENPQTMLAFTKHFSQSVYERFAEVFEIRGMLDSQADSIEALLRGMVELQQQRPVSGSAGAELTVADGNESESSKDAPTPSSCQTARAADGRIQPLLLCEPKKEALPITAMMNPLKVEVQLDWIELAVEPEPDSKLANLADLRKPVRENGEAQDCEETILEQLKRKGHERCDGQAAIPGRLGQTGHERLDGQLSQRTSKKRVSFGIDQVEVQNGHSGKPPRRHDGAVGNAEAAPEQNDGRGRKGPNRTNSSGGLYCAI